MSDLVAGVAVVVLLIAWLPGVGPTQEKINDACRGKGGVISYADHMWGATNGSATVVCGDRRAYSL